MPTLSLTTCDVNGAETSLPALLHAAPTTVVDVVMDRNTNATMKLTHSSPIRAISLTNTGTDSWCVERLSANGLALTGAAGVWLDNPVSPRQRYPRYEAHVWYTWLVPDPQRELTFSFSTCDESGANMIPQSLLPRAILLHTSTTTVVSSQQEQRGVRATFELPESTQEVSLTATGPDGWCVEDVRLNGARPSEGPPAVWLDNPPAKLGGYSHPAMVSATWRWGSVPSPSTPAGGGSNAGALFGMFVLGFVVGPAVVALSIWLHRRYRAAEFPFHKRPSVPVLSTRMLSQPSGCMSTSITPCASASPAVSVTEYNRAS